MAESLPTVGKFRTRQMTSLPIRNSRAVATHLEAVADMARLRRHRPKHVEYGSHMRRGERGDLTGKDDGERQRSIFHDRHECVIRSRAQHLLIPFLLKRDLGAREAANVAIIATDEPE